MDIYNFTDSICAELSLIAISSLQGHVIDSDLTWALKSGTKSYTEASAKALFRAAPGEYKIIATHKNKDIAVGSVKLIQGKRVSRVILLHEIGGNDGEPYFVSDSELDKLSEFTRRQLERSGLEGQFDLTGGPLADPYQRESSGQGFAQHPLLQSAAFDGLPPDLKIDPAQNDTAVQKQLDLKHQHQHQLASSPGMSGPSPL